MDQTTPDTGGTVDQTPEKARGGKRNRRPIHFLLSVNDKTGKPVAGTDLQVSVVTATRDSEKFFAIYKNNYGQPGVVAFDYTPNGDKPTTD